MKKMLVLALVALITLGAVAQTKKDSKKQEKPAKEDDSAKAEGEASAEKND